MKIAWGAWAFILGLVLSAVIAIFTAGSVPVLAVVVIAALGVVVGIMNITDKEIQLFLVASITFLLSFGALSEVFQAVVFGWKAVGTFFDLMAVFVAPAAAIVAVKALFRLAKN